MREGVFGGNLVRELLWRSGITIFFSIGAYLPRFPMSFSLEIDYFSLRSTMESNWHSDVLFRGTKIVDASHG